LGSYYHNCFNDGDRRVIDLLELEEANLLHARRLARRNQWWVRVISCMQGLLSLYEHQGRMAEWAKLVEEIRPDYCTDDGEPVPGREDDYTFVMGYRIGLVKDYERDFVKAAALQEKLVKFHRQRTAPLLSLPADVLLNDEQRNRLRSLRVSVFTLGQILREQGDEECVKHYRESISHAQRISDKLGEVISEYNLGHAYMQLSAIRDLDAAEAAYRRSLDLVNPNDALGRSRCIKQIGMVHHERLHEARQHAESAETLLRHAEAAEACYLEALRLCPNDAPTDLAPIHVQLGNLYNAFGQLDSAREHYEQAAQYFEKAGNHFGAGQTRFNMAIMYAGAAEREEQPSQQRAFLLRARAYGEAALRDFRQYQGRAAADETDAQNLLNDISQYLARRPQ
jgi:tetratricopeptide (TPR) repeat protein